MSDVETRLATLDARIATLREKRQGLKKQVARRREQHLSTGAYETKLQGMTLAQLRLELRAERMRFRTNRIGRSSGPKAAVARERAAAIAKKIEERQSV